MELIGYRADAEGGVLVGFTSPEWDALRDLVRAFTTQPPFSEGALKDYDQATRLAFSFIRQAGAVIEQPEEVRGEKVVFTVSRTVSVNTKGQDDYGRA